MKTNSDKHNCLRTACKFVFKLFYEKTTFTLFAMHSPAFASHSDATFSRQLGSNSSSKRTRFEATLRTKCQTSWRDPCLLPGYCQGVPEQGTVCDLWCAAHVENTVMFWQRDYCVQEISSEMSFRYKTATSLPCRWLLFKNMSSC